MAKKGYFQISTAIDYPSGLFHLGHAYEKVCTDTIARWKRLSDQKVHFSTGTDCHGLKIQRVAEKAGKTPLRFVQEISKEFKNLSKVLNISYDDFVMTIEPRHKKVAQHIMKQLYKNKDIYKGFYEGPYCIDCETYYTEKELNEGNCPVHKRPVEKIKEEGYFFRLSKYKKFLIKELKKGKNVWPKKRTQEILNRLKEPLKDLSISRKEVKWGIPLPFDKKLTEFVWVEALNGYLTTINYPTKKYKDFWPATHIIGSDILWHHTSIWWSILKSLKLNLPNIVVHGMINLNGEKLSKSSGIRIDPIALAEKYTIDSLRYFLLREIPFGDDGDFSENKLVERHNNELTNDLGNLVSRTLTLAERYKEKISGKQELKLNLKKINKLMLEYKLNEALNEIWSFIKSVNKYINDKKPWELKYKKLSNVLYNMLESLRIISILISPFIPETAEKLSKSYNIKLGTIKDCKFKKINYKVKNIPHLFEKIETIKNINKETIKKNTGIISMEKIKFSDWQKLDLRVGKIKAVKDHPNADKLYIILVDIGPIEQNIQLVAGLKQHYTKDELINKKVIVFRNLEPVVIRGEESTGMVLAAVKDNNVTLITPDKDIEIGAKIQ